MARTPTDPKGYGFKMGNNGADCRCVWGVFFTGSSAKLLSYEIATSLRGRSLATEIFPFSFAEYLEHTGINTEIGRRTGAGKRSLLENRLKTYLLEGGFPEVQNIAGEYRIRILQDYLNVVILRDLVERYQISSIVPLRYMIRHLMNTPASLFSINKFYLIILTMP